jgi:glutaredoxin
MARRNKDKPVRLTLYKWAGRFGPFKIKIPCGECALTEDVIEDTLENELADVEVEFRTRDWLTWWWIPLRRGGWHAPIVLVGKKVVSQGDALNRGVLTEAVVRLHATKSPLRGSHLFSKPGCDHCARSKDYLDEAGVDFDEHDVISEPAALYEMLARVKPLIGDKTPVTMPQIWIDGVYVGGANELAYCLGIEVEPNLERGQSSLSKTPAKSKYKRRHKKQKAA